MASKKKPVQNQPIPKDIQPVATPVSEQTASQTVKEPFFTFSGFRLQAVVLAIVGFVFYCNTFTNDWAFDDMLVIVQNDYVHMGFSGIPKILTGDAFESFTHSQNEENNQLSGGRYRPLSIITFAIEQQFLGTDFMEKAERTKLPADAQKKRSDKFLHDMHVRHVVSVLLYILSTIVLLLFFRKIIFPGNYLAAFLAALLFTIHPIHTEVVANVKSRDEILSLLFVCLTFLSAFKYMDTKKVTDLFVAMLCFLMAMLSKEYGVVLIVLLPLSFYWFKGYDRASTIKASLIYLVPLVVYFMLRLSSVKEAVEIGEGDVMNSPYLLATGVEKIATIIYVPINYIRLLFLPHPLAADYTFNQIPYTNFGDWKVWFSLLVHGGMLAAMLYFMKKRHVLGFAIAFYFAFLALVSNVFVNIGAPMGERLIYHSSVGFVIIIAYLLSEGYKKIQPIAVANGVLTVLLAVVVLLCGFKTITRNKDWKTNGTLFPKDVNVVPNSVIANCNAGLANLMKSDEYKGSERDALIRKAIVYFDKSISVNSHYIMAYLNRGTCYNRLGEMDKASADCDTVVKYYPVHPALPFLAVPVSNYYTKEGIKLAGENNDAGALVSFRKAADATPTDANVLYNLAYEYLKNSRMDEGKATLIRILQMKPDHVQARQLLQQLGGVK